ncbi:hypothetical protein GCM10011402_18810 [Paracoccus acridae]|uniref:Secreted protein n=1 Tax=Paracoccus acridae TaxID=1795310 RepID=A0ABQ1VH32_9RHOB|nr:hypothetical protein GCM10011402_18810 [Paracoccus acridae]
MIGSVFDACTRAISVALSVSCVISQAAPTAWTRPPKFDTSVALHSRRKSRCRNGARADAVGGRDAVWSVTGTVALGFAAA